MLVKIYVTSLLYRFLIDLNRKYLFTLVSFTHIGVDDQSRDQLNTIPTCSMVLKAVIRNPMCRVIHPVVVAPTVAAVGLAFFAYGFPVVGRCVEIGIPQLLLLVLFALVS